MGSSARVHGRSQNEDLRALSARNASTQRTRSVSATSVFVLFPATEDAEKKQSPRHNNVARTRATGERQIIVEGMQRA
jgi:hypothetical protein